MDTKKTLLELFQDNFTVHVATDLIGVKFLIELDFLHGFYALIYVLLDAGFVVVCLFALGNARILSILV
jgi:hypothetical protein